MHAQHAIFASHLFTTACCPCPVLSRWDMHAFGAWLANVAADNNHAGRHARGALVANINLFKASNGEEIHGYLWQSLRLLAHEGGTLAGAPLT